MQDYVKPLTSALFISVGMDVHKKTIASCIYHSETGAILDEIVATPYAPEIMRSTLMAKHANTRLIHRRSSHIASA